MWKCQSALPHCCRNKCSIIDTPVFIPKMTLSFITACQGFLDPKRKSHVVNCNVLFIRKPQNLSLYSLSLPLKIALFTCFPGILPEVSDSHVIGDL